ncbi:MAG: hypothetical protein AABX28_00250 [Nanoarchaeota archaeon]
MKITDVNTPKKARVYLIFNALELASTLNVPQENFDKHKYETQKRLYTDTAKLLGRDYCIDASDCDNAIKELEKICLGGKASGIY